MQISSFSRFPGSFGNHVVDMCENYKNEYNVTFYGAKCWLIYLTSDCQELTNSYIV